LDIILAHNNADFDAAAALLGAHKLYPHAIPFLPARLNRNVADFVALYQNGLPFRPWEDLKGEVVKNIILVDTQKLPDVRGLPEATPVFIIDHHPKRDEFAPHETFTGEIIGSTATLLVEQMRTKDIRLTSLEATLLALGVYEDTGSLSYSVTTPRDLVAASWLLEQGGVLDTVRRFLAKPLNAEQTTLLDQLLKQAESRVIQGYAVVVASATIDEYVEQINSVAHRLRDFLEAEALFVVVAHPTGIQLVCRATGDALDVGQIARLFGGGGHPRAAAAAIEDMTLNQVTAQLWQAIETRIQPVTQVADLMSYGAHTVEADQTLEAMIQPLRKIGHEGYPVVENGRVVGLLTRRSADRALEHGLIGARIREVMDSGSVTLRPEDSISTLERRMVESGWGQIPVVDAQERLIGIVTRTDLIKHWAKAHPSREEAAVEIAHERLVTVLGEPAAKLIDLVARTMQQAQISGYLVGGVVRDLLLERPNFDIDFVVEGDALTLAEAIRSAYGGNVDGFRPFGTAKWKPDTRTAQRLGVDLASLPEHIDFATSRNEFYMHPTALPTVYNSSIKLDLGRRDFTINTLAVQLSPVGAYGRVMDFYSGLRDLKEKRIRVLHSLSFIDDPTRILRAVRFKQRLGFELEPRTAELIETAKPMLRRITGGRLREELNLLMRERIPYKGLLELQQRGLLTAIHPDFVLNPQLQQHFEAALNSAGRWPIQVSDVADLHWHLAFSAIPLDRLLDVCERLMFGRGRTQSLMDAAGLVQQPGALIEEHARPSQITARLEGHTELALLTAWILADTPLTQQRIEAFITTWRTVRPHTNGSTLQKMGLPPGPRYRQILERLRAAWLDGEITDEGGEQDLLETLVAGESHDRA
jgi:tRNA nucleotidyltransferase (CCA-adding enzyme)